MMPLKPKIRKQNKTFKQVNVYNLVTKAKSFNVIQVNVYFDVTYKKNSNATDRTHLV